MTATPSSPPPTSTTDDETRTAGRGGIAVLGAKVFFILAGFVQKALLARAIGAAGYGALSIVQGIANIPNNVVVSGATQGVSRAIARARGHEDEALRATLRVHVPLAVIIGVGFVALAPALAAWERAPHVTLPLMVLGGVMLLYGLYAPLIGAINGRRRFGRQAVLDVTFATLRTAGMVGVGYLFLHRGMSGALGATVGFVAAAACILPIALRWTGIGKRGVEGPWSPKPLAYLLELFPLSAAQLCTNLILQADAILLRRFLGDSASVAGLSADDADTWLGYYNAAQLFAFLPYQLLFSITQILFPMLARAKAEGDRAAVKRFVASGARLGAIACGMLVSVVAALPSQLVAFAYPAEFAEPAGAALRILALGQGAFAMLAIALTVLTSLGYEWRSTAITASAVVCITVACFAFVPGATFGQTQLVRTAITTSVVLAAALVVAGTMVRAMTGAFVPFATAARAGLGVAICAYGGQYLPKMGKLMTPVLAVGIVLVYLAILVVTRELRAADLEPVKALLGKKRRAT